MNQTPKTRLGALAVGICALAILLSAAGVVTRPGQAQAATVVLAPQTSSIGNVGIKRGPGGELARAGELVNCESREIVLETRLTYLEFAGICSDAHGPQCAGRLVSLTETCITDPTLMGASANARSRTRICFDPQGEGACGASEQIALIVNTSRSEGSSSRLTNNTVIREARSFEMDGHEVRWLPDPLLASAGL
jgi:hypothetical protein